jgi:hypothetical protein
MMACSIPNPNIKRGIVDEAAAMANSKKVIMLAPSILHNFNGREELTLTITEDQTFLHLINMHRTILTGMHSAPPPGLQTPSSVCMCVCVSVCVFCEGFWFLKHLASIPNSILLNSNCLPREHFRLLPLKPPTNPNSVLCNALQINLERALRQWERALRNWLPSVSEPKKSTNFNCADEILSGTPSKTKEH